VLTGHAQQSEGLAAHPRELMLAERHCSVSGLRELTAYGHLEAHLPNPPGLVVEARDHRARGAVGPHVEQAARTPDPAPVRRELARVHLPREPRDPVVGAIAAEQLERQVHRPLRADLVLQLRNEEADRGGEVSWGRDHMSMMTASTYPCPMSDLVTFTVTDLPDGGGIAHVQLNRPDKLNALTLETLDQLVATARTLRKDKALRAVVLSGEGESFCAGLDFKTVMKKPAGIARAFVPLPWRGTNLFQEASWAWRRLPVPVIAAVQGHCYGGGLQIALGADFRIATPDSEWSVLEGKWGLIPDMSGIQSLSELVGIDTAKRLTMTAKILTGKEAHDLGLVTELAADPVAAADDFARELAARSPDALAAAKRLFDTTWNRGPRRTFALERLEQLQLLFGANAKAAREAAFKMAAPAYRPRARR